MVKVTRSACIVAPLWTFLLGMLIGLLPGGITNPSNYFAIGIYLSTLIVIVPLGCIAHRWELDREAERSHAAC